jgi:hypothetical protein
LLFVGLILAALIPSLVLAALALGLISMPGSEPPVAVTAPLTAAPTAVLTAPDRIAAVSGEDVSFPIALDGTDGVPPRSVVAITGLPRGSNFSEGRPYGDSEWNLKPDQIGDLVLVVPADVHGEFRLGIALRAPDDKVVAAAETLLEIAPVPTEQAAAIDSSVPSPDEAAASGAFPDTGDGAAPEEAPKTVEAATVPPANAHPDQIGPTMKAATLPPGDAPPDASEQSADGKNALGTVQPSVFVNLRAAPSSASAVIGVIAKGAELQVLDRKRGWVQVTDPETAKTGWIYSGLLAGEEKPHRRMRRAAPEPAEGEQKSFWGRVGDWLTP